MEVLVKTVEAVEKRKSKGGKSWLSLLIIIPLILVGLFVAAWVTQKDRRELAKLRHEKNKRRIEKENADTASKMVREEKEIQAALERVDLAGEAINEIDRRMTEASRRHEKNKKLIGRLRWRDLPPGQ